MVVVNFGFVDVEDVVGRTPSIFQVDIDTNSRDLLAEGQAKDDLRTVEVELGGSNRLQLNITTNSGDVILNKTALKQLEIFHKKLSFH